jgi:hypothetical protein
VTQAAAFNAPTLSWTGGALVVRLRAEGVSDRLILTGAFTKNAPGSMPVLLIAGPGFAVGNTYTLVTFASTNFADEDFAATGLPAGFGAVFNAGHHQFTCRDCHLWSAIQPYSHGYK